jgi:hypothetical protein
MGWGFIGGLLPGLHERNQEKSSAGEPRPFGESDKKEFSEDWLHWLANKLATNRGEVAQYPYGARPEGGPALSDSQIFNRKANEAMRGGLSPVQAGTGMQHRYQPPAPAQPQANTNPLMELVKAGMRGRQPSSGPKPSPIVDNPTTGFMMSPTPTTRGMVPMGQLQSARRNRNG